MPGQSNASERLAAIAARLKAEGQKTVLYEMNRALRGAAQPLVTAVRNEARATLPKSGGLADEQADQAIRVSVITGFKTAGVRIRTRTPGSVQTDMGFVRHPVFAQGDKERDEWRWVRQELPAARGWWTNTLLTESAEITPLLVAEMNRIGRIIQGGY